MHELVAEFFGAVEVADVDFEKSFEGFEWAVGLRGVLVVEGEMIMQEVY